MGHTFQKHHLKHIQKIAIQTHRFPTIFLQKHRPQRRPCGRHADTEASEVDCQCLGERGARADRDK